MFPSGLLWEVYISSKICPPKHRLAGITPQHLRRLPPRDWSRTRTVRRNNRPNNTIAFRLLLISPFACLTTGCQVRPLFVPCQAAPQIRRGTACGETYLRKHVILPSHTPKYLRFLCFFSVNPAEFSRLRGASTVMDAISRAVIECDTLLAFLEACSRPHPLLRRDQARFT